jgi:hypothetical protein
MTQKKSVEYQKTFLLDCHQKENFPQKECVEFVALILVDVVQYVMICLADVAAIAILVLVPASFIPLNVKEMILLFITPPLI